jgi:hypothetical protein
MVETDKLIKCSRCGSDACYKQEINGIELYSCYGCGFQTSSVMKQGEKFLEEQMEILPELYKILLGEDEEGLVWMPQTVNLPQQGMVFAATAKEFGDPKSPPAIDNYEWAAVKAIKIPEKDKEKYPIPHKKGEYYEYRMDMTTEKRFNHNDFIEALDYIEVFGKKE